MNKLPEPFKTDFLAALRSGKFKQGKLLLHDPSEDSYCCLGVACIVGGSPVESLHIFYIRGEEFNNVPDILHGAQAIAGELAGMNDSGKTFEEIANFIEENL